MLRLRNRRLLLLRLLLRILLGVLRGVDGVEGTCLSKLFAHRYTIRERVSRGESEVRQRCACLRLLMNLAVEKLI